MEFVKTTLQKVFQIKSLVSLHYFEFAKNFIFKGESHDFWEFVYVDQGEVEIMADSNGFLLKQGEIIFHKPNEFHSFWANHIIAPNLVIISFDCRSKAMQFFENKVFTLGDSERNLLAQIVKEGRNAFSSPFDDPENNTLIKKAGSDLYCEQLIEIYLELLLIGIMKKGILMDNRQRLSTSAKERSTEDVIARLLNYFQENIRENITLKQLCRFTFMGRTQLISLFKGEFGLGIIEYFKTQKIEYAKKLIREENYNLTEISEYLGYSSIHSFSRHFKKVTGANPSEYAKSAKARFD